MKLSIAGALALLVAGCHAPVLPIVPSNDNGDLLVPPPAVPLAKARPTYEPLPQSYASILDRGTSNPAGPCDCTYELDTDGVERLYCAPESLACAILVVKSRGTW